jgi:hypothetical protein
LPVVTLAFVAHPSGLSFRNVMRRSMRGWRRTPSAQKCIYKKFTIFMGVVLDGGGSPIFFLRVYTSVLELIGLRVDRGRIDPMNCKAEIGATFTSGHLFWVYMCKTEIRVMHFQQVVYVRNRKRGHKTPHFDSYLLFNGSISFGIIQVPRTKPLGPQVSPTKGRDQRWDL